MNERLIKQACVANTIEEYVKMYLNCVLVNLRIVSHALCYQRRCQANYELIWPAHKNYVHIFRRPRRHIKIISKHIKITCFDIILYTFIHFVSQNVYPDMTGKNVPIIQSTYLHIHFSRQPDFSLQRRLVRIYNFYTFWANPQYTFLYTKEHLNLVLRDEVRRDRPHAGQH